MPKKKITRSSKAHKEKIGTKRNNFIDTNMVKDVFGKRVIHQIAKETGFTLRRRKLDAHNFFSLVFGSLNGAVTLSALTENVSTAISRSGISKRFTPASCAFLQAVYSRLFSFVTACARQASLPVRVLEAFHDIKILDSSSWKIPAALKEFFAGYNKAGCKIQFLLSYKTGSAGLQDILPETISDQQYAKGIASRLQKDDLILFDLGYAIPEVFHSIAAREAFFICRFNDAAMNIYLDDDPSSDPVDILVLLSTLHDRKSVYEITCFIGKRNQRTRVRLLVAKAPDEVTNRRRQKLREQSQKKGRTPQKRSLELCAWSFLLTNIPPEKGISFQEMFALYAIRWTIEIFFKQLKSVLNIHKTHVKSNPDRLKAEILARSIAALFIAHCFSLARSDLWRRVKREISFEKTVKYFQRHAAILTDKFLRSIHGARAYLQQMIARIVLSCEKYRQPTRKNSLDKLLEQTLYREFKYVKLNSAKLVGLTA